MKTTTIQIQKNEMEISFYNGDDFENLLKVLGFKLKWETRESTAVEYSTTVDDVWNEVIMTTSSYTQAEQNARYSVLREFEKKGYITILSYTGSELKSSNYADSYTFESAKIRLTPKGQVQPLWNKKVEDPIIFLNNLITQNNIDSAQVVEVLGFNDIESNEHNSFIRLFSEENYICTIPYRYKVDEVDYIYFNEVFEENNISLNHINKCFWCGLEDEHLPESSDKWECQEIHPLRLGLIKGRHNMPVHNYILNEVEDPTNIKKIADDVDASLSAIFDFETSEVGVPPETVDLYVTGLTVVLVEAIVWLIARGIQTTLWHYNRDTGEYFPQYL